MSRAEHRPVCWAGKGNEGSDVCEGSSEIRAEVRGHGLGFCV